MAGKRAPGGGRKPKPTKLHLLHGNPSGKNLDTDEPEPEPCIPPRPNFLTKMAKVEWDYIAPKLAALGILTEIDKAALAAYCQAYATWVKASQAIRRSGGDVYKIYTVEEETGLRVWTGTYGTNDYLRVVQRKALKTMKAFLTEFGMTPSSRTRLAVEKPKGKGNAYEEWKKKQAEK